MSNFLLITVPFLTVDHRYYPAAYVAGLIKKSGWYLSYLDLNILIYSACSDLGSFANDWNSENQLRLYSETKIIGKQIIYDSLKNELKSLPPDLIGFSLMSSNRFYAQLVLEVLNELQVDIPVIYGGPDCFPREYYKEYFGLKFTPDIMLTGEAEIALPLFLNEFSTTKNVNTSINGFIYTTENGNLFNTGSPKISFLKDESFFADYSIFDYSKIHYLSENRIVTFCSKGCINKCSFCSESRNYGPYRRRSAIDVISEVENNLLKIPGSYRENATVVFRDSIFNASEKYIREICELILLRELHITWFCLGGFRVILAPELLDLMYRSGLRSIFYGFESASQRVIDLMGKNYDMRIAQHSIADCVERGIGVILPIINGFPGEFTRDFLTSVGFILKYRGLVEFGYSNTCGIFKNTPLSINPDDFCIEKVDEVNYALRDAYNILPVRQLRQIITDTLRKNKNLTDSDVLREFDFNVLPVAAEICLIIYFLSNFLRRWPHDSKFLNFSLSPLSEISSVSTEDGKYSYLENIVPGHSLAGWLACDKNMPEVKEKIISLLSELIKAFEEKILPDFIDFAEFRNSLYDFERVKISNSPPPGFILLSERFSEYDHGAHVIFEGILEISTNNVNICSIEAKCLDYCFDIHHWPDVNVSSKGAGTIRFWGKVATKMIIKNPLIVCIRYSDKTSSCFRLPLINFGHQEDAYSARGFLASAKRLSLKYLPFLAN